MYSQYFLHDSDYESDTHFVMANDLNAVDDSLKSCDFDCAEIYLSKRPRSGSTEEHKLKDEPVTSGLFESSQNILPGHIVKINSTHEDGKSCNSNTCCPATPAICRWTLRHSLYHGDSWLHRGPDHAETLRPLIVNDKVILKPDRTWSTENTRDLIDNTKCSHQTSNTSVNHNVANEDERRTSDISSTDTIEFPIHRNIFSSDNGRYILSSRGSCKGDLYHNAQSKGTVTSTYEVNMLVQALPPIRPVTEERDCWDSEEENGDQGTSEDDAEAEGGEGTTGMKKLLSFLPQSRRG